jgi:hypothetical protein
MFFLEPYRLRAFDSGLPTAADVAGMKKVLLPDDVDDEANAADASWELRAWVRGATAEGVGVLKMEVVFEVAICRLDGQDMLSF